MNNFRRRSSANKERVLVRSDVEYTAVEVKHITIYNQMPIIIEKTSGKAAEGSVNILVDFHVERSNVYYYDDGSVERAHLDDYETSSRLYNAEVYDFLDAQHLLINGSCYVLDKSVQGSFEIPEEGETVTRECEIVYDSPKTAVNETHCTVTVTNTPNNYQVTLTPLSQYS